MEQPTYFEYKGQIIYYTDYSNIIDSEEFVKRIELTREKVIFFLANGYKDILLLNNISNAFINREVITGLKEVAKLGRPIVKKSAVIGVSLSKQIFLNILNKFSSFNMFAFNSKEEACEWLISD